MAEDVWMTKVSNDNFYGIRACVSSVAGGAWQLRFFRSYCLAPDAPAWIFADQLTLFKAGGGSSCPPHYYLAPAAPKSSPGSGDVKNLCLEFKICISKSRSGK